MNRARTTNSRWSRINRIRVVQATRIRTFSPQHNWIATANVVLYCGATPVFADVDARTYNIDPSDVARKLTSRTRAVIPVHLFGLCADMDELRAVIPAGVKVGDNADRKEQ